MRNPTSGQDLCHSAGFVTDIVKQDAMSNKVGNRSAGSCRKFDYDWGKRGGYFSLQNGEV